MRAKDLYIPPGYVAGVGEIVFCVAVFFFLVFASAYMLGDVKEIPSLPGRLVMENAYIYRDVSQSKNDSYLYLYLKVGLDDDAYYYTIVARSSDLRHLDLRKSRKLWVAVDSDRSKRFVWWVYDFDNKLIISRKEILDWIKYYNGGNYFVAILGAVSSLYLLLIIVRNGVWNRVVAKRKAHESRAD
ncbi:hypothetical protein [Pseudomonas baetica]|uniref:hypothetical protein n=1 Tax=Pseudomonas baetica TaxID=674054 RepID=UPI002405D46F|nr:hypothetical protein [Pseudomonas baetica]MDF9776855.1 hypothetical protein [Pseudomonas baetica]